MEGFEKCQKKFIRLHAEPVRALDNHILVFPKGLSGRLEQLALKMLPFSKTTE